MLTFRAWRRSTRTGSSLVSEAHDREIEEAFRPGRRPAWVAVVLNMALAAALLGFPYVRGRLRAVESADQFALLATCLYGGVPTQTRGLGFPPLDREHFAMRATSADPAWPSACLEHLDSMRPEPAIFLFPTPKRAEEDLRRALDQVRAELSSLARNRTRGPLGAVPERPLRALAQLRAALSNRLEASDIPVDPNALAFEFDDDAEEAIVRPSRIPLRTGVGGTFAWRPEAAGGLRAVLSDGRAVTEVTVTDGSVELTQVRRPPAVRGMVLGPERGVLVWATGEATCASDPSRCAGRVLGLAAMPESHEGARPSVWLSAHPVGRLDRTLRIEPGFAWVLSVAADGVGVDLRKFAIEPWPTPGAEQELRPVAPILSTALGQVADALLTPRGALWVTRREGELALFGDSIPGAVRVPEPFAEQTRQVALSQCDAWISVATPGGIVLVHGGVPMQRPIVRALREPLLGSSDVDDSVRMVCHEGGVDVVAIDRRRNVLCFRCAPEGCAGPETIAEGASQVSAVRGSDETVVAWTGDAEHPQIHVVRVEERFISVPEIPAPCWDSGQGMCGAPYLVVEGRRVLIAARESSDLRVLEVVPDGFRPLPGL